MVHRQISIPLHHTDFRNEMLAIERIAKANGISIDVQKLIHKKLVTKALNETTTHPRTSPPKKWVRVPFLRNISSKLARVLKLHTLTPTFYALNSLKNNFSHLKDPILNYDQSGIYSIQCNDCPALYVGSSGKKIQAHVEEHEDAIKKNTPDKSNFANHILSNDHHLISYPLLVSCTQ